MKVLMIATESLPFAKSGGLGDVIGALPKALNKQGVETAVMMPLYGSIKEAYKDQLKPVGQYETLLSWRSKYAGLYKLGYEGVVYYFIDNEEYFDRSKYYGYWDDGERFAYFCKAALDALPLIDFEPDILHLSEWQTALVAVYLKTWYAGLPDYDRLRTVFTIHNIEYQGQYDSGSLEDLFGIDKQHRGLVEYNGFINLLKGAIVACDRLTTVSPSYAGEIQYGFYAKGLENMIQENAYKLRGILNGIDERYFNPWFDPYIPVKYSAKSMHLKVGNKTALQSELELDVDEKIPMIGMITRLVPHKGIDLVTRVFDEIMGERIQFVLLGSGEKQYEAFFLDKMQQYPGRFYYNDGFSETLARKIYAGSDLFLMPSVSEPCGLAQMIAAKHGTVPIVRETGGLKDSIVPYDAETGAGNGITFKQINAQDMLGAIKRAIALYYDETHWDKVRINAITSDFSWKKGAKEYKKLYKELEKKGK